MLDADEAFFKQTGTPLFSSHMIDLVSYCPFRCLHLIIWLANRFCGSLVCGPPNSEPPPPAQPDHLNPPSADTINTEESVEENIETSAKYLARAAPMKQWLEMEIGITVWLPSRSNMCLAALLITHPGW